VGRALRTLARVAHVRACSPEMEIPYIWVNHSSASLLRLYTRHARGSRAGTFASLSTYNHPYHDLTAEDMEGILFARGTVIAHEAPFSGFPF
jgi:hypothetical protein